MKVSCNTMFEHIREPMYFETPSGRTISVKNHAKSLFPAENH